MILKFPPHGNTITHVQIVSSGIFAMRFPDNSGETVLFLDSDHGITIDAMYLCKTFITSLILRKISPNLNGRNLSSTSIVWCGIIYSAEELITRDKLSEKSMY